MRVYKRDKNWKTINGIKIYRPNELYVRWTNLENELNRMLNHVEEMKMTLNKWETVAEIFGKIKEDSKKYIEVPMFPAEVTPKEPMKIKVTDFSTLSEKYFRNEQYD